MHPSVRARDRSSESGMKKWPNNKTGRMAFERNCPFRQERRNSVRFGSCSRSSTHNLIFDQIISSTHCVSVCVHVNVLTSGNMSQAHTHRNTLKHTIQLVLIRRRESTPSVHPVPYQLINLCKTSSAGKGWNASLTECAFSPGRSARWSFPLRLPTFRWLGGGQE